MMKTPSSRTRLLSFQGGAPCEAYADHGFNELEKAVARQIAVWIQAGKK